MFARQTIVNPPPTTASTEAPREKSGQQCENSEAVDAEEDAADDENFTNLTVTTGIVKFRLKNRNHVRCEICLKFPEILNRHNLRKFPAIAGKDGTRLQSSVVQNHISSRCHLDCVEANRVKSVQIEERPSTSMEFSIRKANQKQLIYISSLMIEVFFDAKYLSLTGYSCRTVADNINLQYVNPHGHDEIMMTIVKAHREDFTDKLEKAWAISIRVDGSIDFTHRDKIYVMAKIIDLHGNPELLLIGIAEQTQRKSIGLKNAVLDAIKTNIDDPHWLLRRVSSLCTDGTNVNTGEKSSLWQLLDEEMKNINSEIPFLKIWCAAHRAELVWKSTAENLKMIAFLADVLHIFERFQKNLQSNKLIIISLASHVTAVKKTLNGLESEILLGGFEENLAAKVTIGQDKRIFLKSIELLEGKKTRLGEREQDDFPNLRKQCLTSIQTFLDERFSVDANYVETIAPFIAFSQTADADIKKVHEMTAPDVPLANFALQYGEICNHPDMQKYKELSISEIILTLAKSNETREHYKELITVLSRIAAATPHSADVERCISANNRLKTKLRSSLKVEKENKTLFIHYNMPSVAEWTPEKAAQLFLIEKERRSRNVSTAKEGKPRTQPYFAHVFPEATQTNDDDDDDDDPEYKKAQEAKKELSLKKYFDF
ncbi:hypothetical protein Bhyg_02232 [Pseudolycoriella hygida]|uniref:Uncharacterized protein n=1 Tax=Pseudolycoriella hygida TaxID=35572 RepID=A0A9Q0NCU9_9DIPT|nr:hypothetical protein Bhyg_02232 [Pseudolycoriella hygida]